MGKQQKPKITTQKNLTIEGLLTDQVVDGFQKMLFYPESEKSVWIQKSGIVNSDGTTKNYGYLNEKHVGVLSVIKVKPETQYKKDKQDTLSKNINELIKNTDNDKSDTVSSTKSWGG